MSTESQIDLVGHKKRVARAQERFGRTQEMACSRHTLRGALSAHMSPGCERAGKAEASTASEETFLVPEQTFLASEQT